MFSIATVSYSTHEMEKDGFVVYHSKSCAVCELNKFFYIRFGLSNHSERIYEKHTAFLRKVLFQVSFNSSTST